MVGVIFANLLWNDPSVLLGDAFLYGLFGLLLVLLNVCQLLRREKVMSDIFGYLSKRILYTFINEFVT